MKSLAHVAWLLRGSKPFARTALLHAERARELEKAKRVERAVGVTFQRRKRQKPQWGKQRWRERRKRQCQKAVVGEA